MSEWRDRIFIYATVGAVGVIVVMVVLAQVLPS